MKTSAIGWTEWEGETSRWLGINGYVHVRIKGETFLEHRLVAERKLGRALALGEIVHHINEDKTDNRPENITVLSRTRHVRLHCHNDTLRPLGAENELVDCACGCGQKLWRWDAKNRSRRYITGHNTRGQRWRWKSTIDNIPRNGTVHAEVLEILRKKPIWQRISLIRATGRSENSVATALCILRSKGLAECIGHGLWRATT